LPYALHIQLEISFARAEPKTHIFARRKSRVSRIALFITIQQNKNNHKRLRGSAYSSATHSRIFPAVNKSWHAYCSIIDDAQRHRRNANINKTNSGGTK